MNEGILKRGLGGKSALYGFLIFLIVAGMVGGTMSVARASHPGTTVLVDVSDVTSDGGGCGDAANPCDSIQAGIDHANAGDTIEVAAGMYIENVFVDRDVSIVGAGSGNTIVDGSGVLTVFTIMGGTVVELSGMTIQNGDGPFGGGILNAGGSVRISDSTIAGNNGLLLGGGILNFIGGTLTLVNSTVSGNTVADIGGGIANFGVAMAIENSTISGNTANSGGGVANLSSLAVHSSTITSNTADDAGLVNSGFVTIANTIIASQAAGDDCLDVALTTSLGYNLDSDGTCNLFGLGDMPGVDPMLGPLADNRGPMLTHLPMNGSPVIDAGDPAGCTDSMGAPLSADQRGFKRHVGASSRCDIGAVEIQLQITFQLQLVGFDAPLPGQTPPGGNYPITATFMNVGDAVDNVFFRVVVLEYKDGGAPHPEMDNRRTGTPAQEGAEIDVAIPGGILNTGDTIEVTFDLLIPRLAQFDFFTDAFTILQP